MEIGGGPVAGFGSAPAERLSRYRVTRPNGRSLLVFYGHSLRHLRSGYCDAGEPFVCGRNLRNGSLLRNFFDSALVASEDFRVGTGGEPVEPLPSMVKNPDYTQNPGRRVNERYRLFAPPTILRRRTGQRIRSCRGLNGHSRYSLSLSMANFIPRQDKPRQRNGAFRWMA